MPEKEIIISLEDLTALEVWCKKCKSASLFGLGEDTVHVFGRESGPVQCCPNCGEPFGSTMLTYVGNLRQMLKTDKQKDSPFRLKIRADASNGVQ